MYQSDELSFDTLMVVSMHLMAAGDFWTACEVLQANALEEWEPRYPLYAFQRSRCEDEPLEGAPPIPAGLRAMDAVLR